MKAPELIKKVESYLDADKKKQRGQADSIKEILKKLMKKQDILKDKLAKEKNQKSRKQI